MPIPNDSILVMAFVAGMQAVALKDYELVLTCIYLMSNRAADLGFTTRLAALDMVSA